MKPSDMKPDLDQALRFLKTLGPPRVLVAIEPDTGYIVASTPNSALTVKQFIAHFNATCGLYFQVNLTRRPMQRKPRKADIAAAAFAHAEYDPPKNISDLPEWRREFREALEDCLWPPTLKWNSGNGVQALWRLDKPCKEFDEVEAANQGLLDLFHSTSVIAKGVANIDRILRIPGTINWPNLVKRNAGRVAGMAGKVVHHPERVYSLEELPRARMKAKRNIKLTIGEPVMLKSLFDLQCDDATKYRITICNDDGKYPSRSEAEFAVLCELVRNGVPDNIILGILLDSRWQISERVLERGDQAAKAAIREIVNAHKQVAANIAEDFADA